jgi:hypothetical protein
MSYPNATSAYGLMDLSGGAPEWIEDPIYGIADPNAIFGRLADGVGSGAGAGYFDPDRMNLDTAEWYNGGEQQLIGQFDWLGLRLASPVPSGPAMLVVVSGIMVVTWRKRS